VVPIGYDAEVSRWVVDKPQISVDYKMYEVSPPYALNLKWLAARGLLRISWNLINHGLNMNPLDRMATWMSQLSR
jgi:hypothetical protein